MIARRVRAGALLAALLLASCGGAKPDSPRAVLERQRSELARFVASHPGAVRERVALARVALRLGDGVAAEAVLKDALAAGAQPEVLRPLLARAYAVQGDSARAAATLQSGPIAPEMAGEAAWVEADIHLADGNLGAAREAFDRALRARPRDPALWVDIARFRAANADTLGAQDAADYAMELAPANSAALALKANLVRGATGLVASLPWYDKALDADPENVDALFDQAATLGDLGRYRAMLASLRRAAELAPADVRLFYLQAVVAARAGNYPLARSLLQRARGALDDEPGFMLLSAIVELQLGGQALASSWAERLVEVQPHNSTARRILAAASWADADDEGAAAALAPIVARADADSWSLLMAARVAAEQGDRQASAVFQDRAAALAPGEAAPFAVEDDPLLVIRAADATPLDPAAAIPAMALAIADGRADDAIARAVRLRDANPGVAAAHLLLGDAAMAGRRFDLAVAAFRRARALEAGDQTALRLADALSRAGKSAGADAVAAALQARYPSGLVANRAAGQRALAAGEWDRAIALFEAVRSRIGDRDAVILRDLARAWAAKGEQGRALPLIARAYRLQPLNRDIMQLYADLLEAEGGVDNPAALRAKAQALGR